LAKNTWRFPKGVGPQNQSQTWVHHPLSKNCRCREFDLDLKIQPKAVQKNSKNGKPMHGVMIYDMVPRKNTKHDMPRFHRKTLHKNGTKQDFTWISTRVTVVFEISIANFYILDSFLADMCIFPFATTFVTMDF
jgi:hypothetical protein